MIQSLCRVVRTTLSNVGRRFFCSKRSSATRWCAWWESIRWGLMKMQLQSSSNCDWLFPKVWASLAFFDPLVVCSFFFFCQQFGSLCRLCWTRTAPNPTQFLVGILNSAAALSVFVLLDLVIQWETVRIWYSSTRWNWGCRLGRHLVIEASWLNPLVFVFFAQRTILTSVYLKIPRLWHNAPAIMHVPRARWWTAEWFFSENDHFGEKAGELCRSRGDIEMEGVLVACVSLPCQEKGRKISIVCVQLLKQKGK